MWLLTSMVILVVFQLPFIYHAPQMRHSKTHFAANSDYFSEIYPVGAFDSSWGEYEATIYYPSNSSGASTPPNRTGAPYPAIVFAHGFACTKDDYSWIGNYCAAHGYVSILFTTPSQFNPFSAFPQSVEGFRLAIDHLASQNQQAGGLLEGMIDENKIGAMGHSMGAMTSLKAAAEDSRIKAVVSLAPGYFGTFTEPYLDACKSIIVPTQIIMGSEDTICPPSDARNYYDALPSTKEMLIINSAFHDLGIWNAGNEPDWLGYIPGYDPVKQEHYRNTTRRYLISWFNYYLCNDSSYYTYIFGGQAWRDIDLNVLSSLETRRTYSIIAVDQEHNPVKNVELTLFNESDTVIWNGLTDSSGTASFNLTLTSFNYTHTLYIEAVKGNISLTEEIDILSNPTITITLNLQNGQNHPPEASFTHSPSKLTIQDVISFVDASEDQDGTIDSWSWDFGDGATSTSQNPTHQYTDKGNFTVGLTVTDNDGATDSIAEIVTICNLAPTANFTYSPTSPTVDDDVQFTDESTDPEERLSSWLWNFGIGYTSTSRNPTHKFEEAGTYVVKLTVTDDEGATDVMSQTITIKEKPFYEQPVTGQPSGIPLWGILTIIIAITAITAVTGVVFAKKRKSA